MAWRDRIALRSRRQADYAWTVLARILSWALDRGLVAANPCARGGRLYRGSRAEKVWTADDKSVFLARAPAHLHLALMLALWTGQRQGDLLRLAWSSYDGTHIRLRQSKTGRRVCDPRLWCAAQSDVGCNATPSSPIMLTSTHGQPWTTEQLPGGMGSSLQGETGIVGVTFHDLTRSGCHAPCDCRMHGVRDRNYHWTTSAAAAPQRDPRYPLSEPRSGPWRKCDY